MNECFHAKCGERAREAPVCPACKHNNTDVSIHQVDPGKARRDLEKCLSRRHVDRIPLPNPLSLSLSPPCVPLPPSFLFANPPPRCFKSDFNLALLGSPPSSISSLRPVCVSRALTPRARSSPSRGSDVCSSDPGAEF